MLFSRKLVKVKKRHHAWLYSCVFSGRLSTLAVFLLFLSFILQPFHQVLASENSEFEETVIIVAEDVKQQVPDDELIVDTFQTEQSEVTSAESSTDTIVSEEIDEEEFPTENLDTLTPQEILEEDSFNEISYDSVGSSVDESLPEIATETEDAVGSITENLITATTLITDENYYQFSKQACVAVGNGVYHCATKVADAIDFQAVVYSELSEKGNQEIYIKTATGRIKQLTDNEFDDTAPHYDPESRKVVWQRLIDGRYQIVVFSLDEEKETQLTFSRTNNMEPKVSIAGVVWQAWDENDWEVMYFDGSYTEQLTENDAQDVAPVIQDGYVLWSVLGESDQQARVYSLESKVTTAIVGHEGGTVVNPRFVLVYDTRFENGDVITQGFDPATGLSAPITATPAQEPVKIPDTDPLGEIRALIQNKSSQKDEPDAPDLNPDEDNPNIATSTPGTLDLTSVVNHSDTVIASTSPAIDSGLELTEYDLVIVDLPVAQQ